MIATLSGTIAEKLAELVVIDVGGVGYGVLVTNEDYGQLTVGESAKVYVYEHIRENTHELFGFITLDTKDLFEQLLSVNGVGPRMALSVLSIGTTGEVKQGIATGDTKFIQLAAGVGKRVAERIVVDLKDKVGLVGVDLSATGLLQTDGILRQDDAIEALVALGYTPHDAAVALAHVDKSLSIEERIKLALKESK